MPNYNWAEHEERSWLDRFPDWVHGYSEWRDWFGGFGQGVAVYPRLPGWLWSEQNSARWLGLSRPCPRVFISHRRADTKRALRVAWLAVEEGFEFWLDVLDPHLRIVLTEPENQQPILIATIIEMALINSTHVMAVITEQTWGSRWVPYEYGRVKDEGPVSDQVACWVDHAAEKAGPVPEYLHLGAITRSDKAVREWLRRQRNEWAQRYGRCSPQPGGSSIADVPPPL